MEGGAPFRPSLRQILWIGAGVVMLTVLILAGSWLFSPRSSEGSRPSGSARLQEQEVQKQTFQPEEATATVPSSGGEAPSRQDEASPPHPPADESSVRAEAVVSHAEPPASAETPKAPAEASAPVTKEEVGAYGVQVGAFSARDNAAIVQRQLEAKGYHPSILIKGGKYKVVVPGFSDRTSAEKGLAALRHAGFPRAFIVPMEPQ